MILIETALNSRSLWLWRSSKTLTCTDLGGPLLCTKRWARDTTELVLFASEILDQSHPMVDTKELPWRDWLASVSEHFDRGLPCVSIFRVGFVHESETWSNFFRL